MKRVSVRPVLPTRDPRQPRALPSANDNRLKRRVSRNEGSQRQGKATGLQGIESDGERQRANRASPLGVPMASQVGGSTTSDLVLRVPTLADQRLGLRSTSSARKPRSALERSLGRASPARDDALQCNAHRSTSTAPIAHRPSPIAHRPSPIAHRPSPIAHRPSPIAHRPSPIAHRPTPNAQRTQRATHANAATHATHATQNAERRTQNAERRTQNAERRTQNAERRTQNAERRTQNAERRARERGNAGMRKRKQRCWQQPALGCLMSSRAAKTAEGSLRWNGKRTTSTS